MGFPEMLIPMAKQAGIVVPEENITVFDPINYPHWSVYLVLQLGRPIINASSHWENAEIIAAIPKDELIQLSLGDIALRII